MLRDLKQDISDMSDVLQTQDLHWLLAGKMLTVAKVRIENDPSYKEQLVENLDKLDNLRKHILDISSDNVLMYQNPIIAAVTFEVANGLEVLKNLLEPAKH